MLVAHAMGIFFSEGDLLINTIEIVVLFMNFMKHSLSLSCVRILRVLNSLQPV